MMKKIDQYIQSKYNVNMFIFEWDENKAKINLKKHGVSFEEAQSAFFDENARIISDPEHSINEDRFILLGISLIKCEASCCLPLL